MPKPELRPSETLKEFERLIDGKSPESQKGKAAGLGGSKRPPALPEMSSPPMRGVARNHSVAQYDETPFNEDGTPAGGSARGPHM